MESIKISVAICAVPERIHYARQLAGELQEMKPTICVDYHHKGSWYSHKAAWHAMAGDSTHHLTLEEDAGLCRDFIPFLYHLVELAPYDILSLFASRGQKDRFQWAEKHNSHWFANKYGAPGVAVLMPAKMVFDFLYWEMHECPPEMPYEDSRLWGWAWTRDYRILNPTPTPVEHTLPMNSSFGFNNRGKVSNDFLADRNWKEIDWRLGLPDPKVFKYTTGQGTFKEYTKRGTI